MTTLSPVVKSSPAHLAAVEQCLTVWKESRGNQPHLDTVDYQYHDGSMAQAPQQLKRGRSALNVASWPAVGDPNGSTHYSPSLSFRLLCGISDLKWDKDGLVKQVKGGKWMHYDFLSPYDDKERQDMSDSAEGPGVTNEWLPQKASDIHGAAITEFDQAHPPLPCVFPMAIRFDDWKQARMANLEYNGSTELKKLIKANQSSAKPSGSTKIEVDAPDKFKQETLERSCAQFIEEMKNYFIIAQVDTISLQV